MSIFAVVDNAYAREFRDLEDMDLLDLIETYVSEGQIVCIMDKENVDNLVDQGLVEIVE